MWDVGHKKEKSRFNNDVLVCQVDKGSGEVVISFFSVSHNLESSGNRELQLRKSHYIGLQASLESIFD